MFKKMDQGVNRSGWVSRLMQAMVTVFAAFCVMLSMPVQAGDDYLEPEAAFKFSARMADAKTIQITYLIADGYYMYRERLGFKAEGALLGTPVIPQGKIKFDDTFQKNVETYRKTLTINLPVEANGSFTLVATSQGCADKGLCYAPMDSQATLSPNGGGGLLAAMKAAQGAQQADAAMNLPQSQEIASSAIGAPNSVVTTSSISDMGSIEASLKSGKLFAILPLFLLLGLGLSFTPCVLPMVPILSSIIVGEGAQVRHARGFALALAYSLGMAVIYTALGIAAGLIGEGLSASLQNPWVLSGFALLMIALSLIAVVYVGLVAMVQQDMKKLVAYSSVAHMGFVTLGFFIFNDLGVSGGLVQMIAHGFVSAAMFLSIGVLYDRVHSREIASYGGVVNTMPKFAAFALLFSMANCGLPGTAGFVGEWMVILGAVKFNFWIGFAAASALIFGAAYTLWMFKRVYLGPVTNTHVKSLLDINSREFIMLALLAAATLYMGVYPKPFTDVMDVSVAQLLKHVALSKLN